VLYHIKCGETLGNEVCVGGTQGGEYVEPHYSVSCCEKERKGALRCFWKMEFIGSMVVGFVGII
jgi:hypothetical protein